MPIDNQIASRHWRSRRAIPTTFRAAPAGGDFETITTRRTPLVALTDPKVSMTPSSNRFAFTLDNFVLAFQMVSGLASGTSIPLAIGFVVQNPRARMVVDGVAAYAMNIEQSLNISASIEGWFGGGEYLSQLQVLRVEPKHRCQRKGLPNRFGADGPAAAGLRASCSGTFDR